MRSTVRKAARLAVYEEMRMVVKNHQMPATMRDEAAFGFRSELLVATKGRIEIHTLWCIRDGL